MPEPLISQDPEEIDRFYAGVRSLYQRLLDNAYHRGYIAPLDTLMDEMGDMFKEAPASSMLSRHHCFAGGLMYHNLEVFGMACRLYAGMFPMDWGVRVRGELLIVSLLHDWNKVCDPLKRPLYIPNHLGSGERSERKPWKVNPQYMGYALTPQIMVALQDALAEPMARYLGTTAAVLDEEGDRLKLGGKMSMLTICSFCPEFDTLTEDMIQAIKYHDGGYGAAKYDVTGGESRLMILVHAADMLSSRFEGDFPVNPVESFDQRLPHTLEEDEPVEEEVAAT